MKIISWNVNGIRSCEKKGFFDFLKTESPDIICLQEVRAEQEQVDLSPAEGYEIYWNSAEKKLDGWIHKISKNSLERLRLNRG